MTKLYELSLKHPHISTDTRQIEPDSLFFALRGANFDGNRFVHKALEQGAAYAVADDPSLAGNDRILLVSDVLAALQELAREHRRALGIPILGITGSNGKTTTKELVSRVLTGKFPKLYATRGNLNNHIGVPLTLLAMTSETRFGVVEMGASACGEIALLTSICEPNYGLITNIGRAHLEGFGGLEGVRRGKGELFDFLASHSGRAFVPQEDAILSAMADERLGLTTEHYSTVLSEGIEHQLEGDYNRFNVAAAVAIGRFFNIDDAHIRQAIENYTPDNNRSQRTQTTHNTLIVDCYNANPSSMHASVENFLDEPLVSHTRRLLLLGDMLELGEWSEAEHTEIIRLVSTAQNAEISLVGREFGRAYAHLNPRPAHIVHYPSREELGATLRQNPVSDALILIKGSRGIGLEKIIELL